MEEMINKKNNIESKIKGILSGILGLTEVNISESLSRKGTGEWDSFNHLLLISKLEEVFGITFTMAEVQKIDTLSDITELIIEKSGVS